jgi:hypothetical protein
MLIEEKQTNPRTNPKPASLIVMKTEVSRNNRIPDLNLGILRLNTQRQKTHASVQGVEFCAGIFFLYSLVGIPPDTY